MIQVEHLSKRFGLKRVVDDVSFEFGPGHIMGFVGPNGAGKTTTLLTMLGLLPASGGRTLIDGLVYHKHKAPMEHVGAVFSPSYLSGGLSGRSNLVSIAMTNGIPASRADACLERVGLSEVAGKRVRQYSLGMAQRLMIAMALLGDPTNLILDEPLNGLDPEGVRWVRTLLKEEAARGKCVLVSSHLLSEMAQTADSVVVIGKGRTLAQGPIDEIIAQVSGADKTTIRVECANPLYFRNLAE